MDTFSQYLARDVGGGPGAGLVGHGAGGSAGDHVRLVFFGWIMVMSVCTLRALSRAAARLEAGQTAAPANAAPRPAT